MYPRRFRLHRPAGVDEALALLAGHGESATPYAGGTELLVVMKERLVAYDHVVDLKGIAAMQGVAATAGGGVSIGALCSHHQLAADRVVRERMPGYAELSANIANIRVRVAGTLGGNLCFAEPHADPPAMLCALGAEVVLAGSQEVRRVPMADFFVGELQTVRADDELMTRIEVPALPAGTRAAYRAFGHLSRPAVGVAACATPEGKGYAWRLYAGSLCGRPTPLDAVADAMRGLPGDDALAALDAGVEAAAHEVEAHDDLRGSADYKRHLLGVLARRAMRAALGREERT